MTCRFTLVMSTFWLNSGGNLVLLSSFASTPEAILVMSWGAGAKVLQLEEVPNGHENRL